MAAGVAAAGDHQAVVVDHGAGQAERCRLQLQRRQRPHQAEAGGQVVGHHAGRDAALVVGDQLHLVGLEDQVADRQHQAVAGR
jgi:hypothetical protein